MTAANCIVGRRTFLLLPAVAILIPYPVQGQKPTPRFTTASISLSKERPTHQNPAILSIGHGTVKFRMAGYRSLILAAYPMPVHAVVWPIQPMAFYDVTATYPSASTPSEIQAMFQALLKIRLGLQCHWETRPLDLYLLSANPDGTKLVRSTQTPNPSSELVLRSNGGWHLWRTGPVQAFSTHDPIEGYGNFLSRPVEDSTGLGGFWEMHINVPPDPSAERGWKEADFLAAFVAQLGLTLQPKTIPTRMLVIDQLLSKPTPPKR